MGLIIDRGILKDHIGVDEGTARAARGCTALGHQLDFNGFHAVAQTSRTGGFPVLGPIEPTVVLHVDPVIHIVCRVQRRIQLDLNGFQPEAAPRGPAEIPIGAPALPPDVLHMGAVGDGRFRGQVIRRGRNLDTFQAEALTDGSSRFAILLFCLPAIALHMGGVIHRRIGKAAGIDEGTGCFARSRIPLVHNLDFNGFHPVAQALGPGFSAVFSPIQPTVILDVDPVINVEILGFSPRQIDLDGFHPQAFSHGPGHVAVGHFVLPADILYMGLIADTQ